MQTVSLNVLVQVILTSCPQTSLYILHEHHTFDISMYIVLNVCLEAPSLLQLFLTKEYVPVHSDIPLWEPLGIQTNTLIKPCADSRTHRILSVLRRQITLARECLTFSI